MASDSIARFAPAWIVIANFAAFCCVLPARAVVAVAAAAASDGTAAAADGTAAAAKAKADAELRDAADASKLQDSIVWLFPLSAAGASAENPDEGIKPVHLADSRLEFTEAQLPPAVTANIYKAWG